ERPRSGAAARVGPAQPRGVHDADDQAVLVARGMGDGPQVGRDVEPTPARREAGPRGPAVRAVVGHPSTVVSRSTRASSSSVSTGPLRALDIAIVGSRVTQMAAARMTMPGPGGSQSPLGLDG